ncbi:MAG: uracil phosphoribosyltransferase [Candidatus Paraprevotella stercoravium]|uniref:Uracil phosphoribosyltransferase n=2 Tax=Bacteroidales TaxID=171549 RepID=A0ABT7U4C3_9BACE|nr:uracil phosphoribosyltransferase [Candidatus Paraprevotella stercoravium]MDM8144648.1 uracil phosphoribosyltransferase [Bacteroides eggerthii]
MKIIDFGKQKTVINKYIEELRNVEVQNDRARFRRNLERIGEMMAFEISKTLNYSTKEVETPLGTAQVCTHDDAIVLATIFRAGLPFHQGFLNVFDHADNAFVSAYRYYKDKECHDVGIHIEYIASPSMEGKTLIIADPMLATGGSMELGLKAFETKGSPAHIHLCCVIASRPGVEFLQKLMENQENVTLWCAAIDDELNERMYIVPGLGDAGDLAYGEKI